MCTYNGGELVRHAVADILEQSYANLELIISDDMSTDGTREWLAQLTDERVRVFLQPQNLGYVRNKNFALSQARGDFITQQDQDDRSNPDRLRLQVAAAHETGMEIIACGYRRVLPNGTTINEVKVAQGVAIHEKGTAPYPFWFVPLLASKAVYDRIGNYSDYFAGAFGDDIYWTVKANATFKIWCLPDILYDYVDAPNSITSLMNNPRKLIMPQIIERLIEQRRTRGTDDLEQGDGAALKYTEDCFLNDRDLLAEQYQIYAARCIDQGKFSEARTLLIKAFLIKPVRLALLRTIAYYLKGKVGRAPV